MKHDAQNPLNIAVFISGYGSNLQAIIDAVKRDKLPVNIALVFSDRADAHGLQKAKAANLTTKVLTEKEVESKADYDAALIMLLKAHNIELIVLAGFMKILGPGFVNHFENQIINIHPALLPKYIGSNTYERVLEAGDKEHGTTVHIVTEACDAGPIILQESVPVLPEDNIESLRECVQAVEHRIYPQVIGWFAQGKIDVLDGKVVVEGNSAVSA